MVALETSSFTQNMAKLLDDANSGTDVTFIFSDETTIEAHRVVLCCASSLFRRIFLSYTALPNVNASKSDAKKGWKLTSKDINNGRVTGFVLVSNDRDIPYDCVHYEEKQRIFLTLREDISRSTFRGLLCFMYTGKLNVAIKTDEKLAMALLDLAQTFQVDMLAEFLEGEQEMSEINLFDQWKTDFVSFNDELFCNSPRFSDVSFRVEGQLVRAHLCVLVARCDFMAAMLSGNFQENSQHEVCYPYVFDAVFTLYLYRLRIIIVLNSQKKKD